MYVLFYYVVQHLAHRCVVIRSEHSVSSALLADIVDL